MPEKTATELYSALRARPLQGTPAIDVALELTPKLLAALEHQHQMGKATAAVCEALADARAALQEAR